MTRLLSCRASTDYQLWLRFADGVAGTLYVGNLLEIGAFCLWRDSEYFTLARIERDAHAVVWPGGVRLDGEILHAELEARFGSYRKAIAADGAFQRFMARVLSSGEPRRLANKKTRENGRRQGRA